jgi:NADH:ubiquinone oxidoreductase subunit E
MEILKKVFNSKKFWYTVGAIFVPFIATKLGLSEAEVEKVYYAILTL